MSPPISLGILNERVEHLRRDLDDKHEQNRKDIHSLRNGQEHIVNSIWLIKVKLALWSGAGGAITAITLHLVDKYWK